MEGFSVVGAPLAAPAQVTPTETLAIQLHYTALAVSSLVLRPQTDKHMSHASYA